jgi:serine/threonine protein phosphatase PrpC
MAPSVRVPVSEHRVVGGDRFLLCSDGLSGPLAYDELGALLLLDEPPEVLVELLIDAANQRGGPDNIAALVVDCGVEAERPSQASLLDDDGRYDPELLILGIEELDVRTELFNTNHDLLETLIQRAKLK